MTKIMGISIATAEQMAKYLQSKNANPKLTRNISILDFCKLWISECEKEGVRGDIAFSQACKETGWFNYGGDVKYTQNNFSGIGATGGVPGCSFSCIEEGILAQAQHLKTYASMETLNCKCVDPRRTNWFVNTKGGTSPDVETLGGTWAVPGYDTRKYSSLAAANNAKDSYGYQIINILDEILSQKGGNSMGYTNSSLVTYERISRHKANRTHVIDTITIHCYVGQVTAKNGCDYFATITRSAAANYLVGYDGSIGLSVPESYMAYTSSNSANDNRAVTIEVASDSVAPYKVTDKALSSLIRLCADICRRNGIKKLVWSTDKNTRINHLNGCNMTVHRDFAAKACPGDYLYNKHYYIASEVNKLLGVNATPSQTAPSAPVTTPVGIVIPMMNIVKGDNAQFVQIVKNIKLALNTDYGLKFDVNNGAIDDILLINLGNVVLSTSSYKRNITYCLQQLLRWWGFTLGIDGDYGPETAQNVENFQICFGFNPRTKTTTKAFWEKVLGK